MSYEMDHRYDDILYEKRPVTAKTPLSAEQRAAQFMPFSAVVGYEEKVEESARITAPEHILSPAEQEDLNRKLQFLAAHIQDHYPLTVTCFVPDERKAGGSYHRLTGTLRRLDFTERRLYFYDASGRSDGVVLPMGCVVALECEAYKETSRTFPNAN